MNFKAPFKQHCTYLLSTMLQCWLFIQLVIHESFFGPPPLVGSTFICLGRNVKSLECSGENVTVFSGVTLAKHLKLRYVQWK